jgi:hypothetical protein
VVEIDEIPVEKVGGTLETLTFEGETIDGVTIGETQATSEYPDGATFVVDIEAEEEIDRVTLFVRYPHNSGLRSIATPTGNENEWQAVIYDRPGQPPWQEMDFYWSVTLADGSFVESSAHQFVYSDPTREWYRSATPLLKLYWFGEDESFGQVAQEAMYAVRERHEIAFGGGLGYTPIAVLFPDLESFSEFRSGGTAGSARLAGFTSNDLGMTVQRFTRSSGISSCPIYPVPEERTDEFVYNSAATTISHEVTHLYQYENNLTGPIWFQEGGATWFSYNPFRGREEGLRDRGPNDDLPTLQGYGPSSSSFTPSGCNALVYWMGTSFYQYLYGAYGLDAIAEWHDLLRTNTLMDNAMQQAFGKGFAELEMDWRQYLGLPRQAATPIPTEPYRFPPTMTPFGQ